MSVEKRDPHSGYLTTGHEWNGITELNRPVPKLVWLFLAAAFAFSVIYWVLMPAWPLGDAYTKGVLGIDQRTRVRVVLERAAEASADWVREIERRDYSEILKDKGLVARVRASGHALYLDSCSACHGANGGGGPGFPSLSDRAWLWGGAPDAVAETLRVGVNAAHEETRVSQMLAFGRDGVLTRQEVLDVVDYVRALPSATPSLRMDPRFGRGAQVYAQNCSACHGPNGLGDIEAGAPNLTDEFWLYGGDRQSVFRSVYGGRQGEMPSWEGRLTPFQRKVLTLYVLDLGYAGP